MTGRPTMHTDADIVTVAEGLTLVMGVDGAAEQVRRIYGSGRAAEALLPLATTETGTLDLTSPSQPTGALLSYVVHGTRLQQPRAEDPRPGTGQVFWL